MNDIISPGWAQRLKDAIIDPETITHVQGVPASPPPSVIALPRAPDEHRSEV